MNEIDKKIQNANLLHDEMKHFLKPTVDARDIFRYHLYNINKNKKNILIQYTVLFILICLLFVYIKPNILTYTKKNEDKERIRCILKYRLVKVSLLVSFIVYVCIILLSDKFSLLQNIIYNT